MNPFPWHPVDLGLKLALAPYAWFDPVLEWYTPPSDFSHGTYFGLARWGDADERCGYVATRDFHGEYREMSDDAEIDTKPELEIYADDVKCSHGATCGDLDPIALFYLRSRGLPRTAAESVLTFAFAAEVIERFADPTVRQHVRKAAVKRLPGGSDLEELA